MEKCIIRWFSLSAPKHTQTPPKKKERDVYAGINPQEELTPSFVPMEN
jgi:hypothetical protein